MKKSKITKLLPVAMALMLFCPAFAATNKASSDQVITVPKFINITHDETSVEETSATFNDEYTTITLDAAMNTKFKVITNNPDEVIKLTATALADGGQVNAIYGDDTDNLRLVFTNNGSDARAATQSAVTNITGGTAAPAQNANAIAFTLTPTITPDDNSGAQEATPTKEADGVKYELSNGIYEFNYTLAQTAVANTFSTHDTDGTYKATLTMSQVSP